MHLREVWQKCLKLANTNNSALEVFNTHKGVTKVFKYTTPDGIVYEGFKRSEGDIATPIATIIRHQNGDFTNVKAGVTTRYIKANGGLKI